MADKETCPGCGTHTSSVLRAVDAGEAMPCCGLSYTAFREIETIRERRANADVSERAAAAVARADKAEQALRVLTVRYDLLERLLTKAAAVMQGELDGFYKGDELYVE